MWPPRLQPIGVFAGDLRRLLGEQFLFCTQSAGGVSGVRLVIRIIVHSVNATNLLPHYLKMDPITATAACAHQYFLT